MNKIAERLYNGIVKENPTFVLDTRYVPDTGGHNIRKKRTGHGTYHNGGVSLEQRIYFPAP